MKTLRFLIVLTALLPTFSIAQQLKEIDEFTSFNEGLAAVRKGNQWGFIDKEGTLVIDFRSDLYFNKDADPSKTDIMGIRYPIFQEGRCMITKTVEEGISVYGFIDPKGNVVIEPQFLNVYPFENGFTTGVLFEKTLRGENEFKLKIYDFKFHDVVLDVSGKIDEYLTKRSNIQMTKKRYKLPSIGAKMLADNLIAVKTEDNRWEIRKLNP
ncbi:MAG: WG repeat-containing protein [Maribacter sp.]|nr:WG repeat-containing protein [Maribacter sp.]